MFVWMGKLPRHLVCRPFRLAVRGQGYILASVGHILVSLISCPPSHLCGEVEAMPLRRPKHQHFDDLIAA